MRELNTQIQVFCWQSSSNTFKLPPTTQSTLSQDILISFLAHTIYKIRYYSSNSTNITEIFNYS